MLCYSRTGCSPSTHSALVARFPDAVSTIVPILMEFLGDANQASAVDVILFVREIVETYAHLVGRPGRNATLSPNIACGTSRVHRAFAVLLSHVDSQPP